MSKPVSGLKILDRLRAGNEVMSWDVHHTALVGLVHKGLVICRPDCRVVLAKDDQPVLPASAEAKLRRMGRRTRTAFASRRLTANG